MDPACTRRFPDGTAQVFSGDHLRSDRMTPTQIENPEHAPAVRRLDCAGYRECLDVTERSGWKGFSCVSCTAYTPIDPEQRAHDLVALGALRLALELGIEGHRSGRT